MKRLHACTGGREPANGVGVTHQGRRLPGKRCAAPHFTAARPPPVARIESTRWAGQVGPTSRQSDGDLGLRDRQIDEDGMRGIHRGPGAGDSNQRPDTRVQPNLFVVASHRPMHRGGEPCTDHPWSPESPARFNFAYAARIVRHRRGVSTRIEHGSKGRTSVSSSTSRNDERESHA